MIVVFHGDLKTLCPDPVTVNARTPRQALEALKSHPKLNPKVNRSKYESEVVGLRSVKGLDEDWPETELHIKCKRVFGRLSGAGGSIKNPIVRFVIGVILIYIAFQTGYGEAGLEGAALIFGQAAMSMGIAMAAGALVEILAPAPEEQDKKSHLASTYGNTVKAGTPIPIIVGEHLWGGHFISYNVDTYSTYVKQSGASGLDDRVLNADGTWVYADGRGYWQYNGEGMDDTWVMGTDGGYWQYNGEGMDDTWVMGPGGGYWTDSGFGTNDVWVSGGYADGRGYWTEGWGSEWVKGSDGGYYEKVDGVWVWVVGAGGGYWDDQGNWVKGG